MSVYFMTCRSLGQVKIGHSCNPQRRLETLQSGCPMPLVIEATMRGGRAQEMALHSRFAAHRRQGEWFELTPEIDALITERRRAQNDKWFKRQGLVSELEKAA
ncbi:GIY-YIG nuclease family protein [Pelagerythrobacter marinus]|uniref:GIY-YIG nuclease family protein n=1 Tax=Pelagerythrobacter marinus TaxID=538382 RepID=UPI002AC975C5|nr:GIY-YIG nuclease family protein [Pelagerythrobacter marinus]WPZ05514.1 GIY-YIG nuclease family protein [Pelagerythrobacter marinus]